MIPVANVSHAMGALESRYSKSYRHNNTTADSVYGTVLTNQLPSRIDLREIYGNKVPVRDQGSDGACVAFAVNVVAQQLELQDTSQLKENLSPLFTYLQRENPESEGMFINDAMKIVEIYGVVREHIVPYNDPNIKTKQDIPKNAYKEGAKHKMGVSAQVWTLDALKKSIDQRKAGAVIAFRVYNFGVNFWKKDNPNENIKGNHCVAVVGYQDPKDNEDGYFIIQNSWGTEWGDKGYTYYSYEDFKKNHHFEIWTFVDITGSEPFEEDKRRSCTIL
jgi:C1A family cysteine protease